MLSQNKGVFDLTSEWADGLLPPRKRDSHKGDYGRLALICGGRGYAGAACLATRAALRGGCGLTTACVPRSVYPVVAASANGAIVLPLAETRQGALAPTVGYDKRFLDILRNADAFTAGCGLLPTPTAGSLLKGLLAAGKPLVIDAGMLHFLSAMQKGDRHILLGGKPLHDRVILTPHMGELSRILGYMPEREPSVALSIAQSSRCVLVMKGSCTLVASPDGRCGRNTTGNPGMAKGGSGDVLAGLIGSLACLLPPFEAACLGVYLHGLAGDRARDAFGENAVIPEDYLAFLNH